MKPLTSNRKFACIAAGFAVAVAAVCLGCSALEGAAPEDALLIRRMHAVINLGWGWLHAKDLRIVAREKKGGDYAVTFSYAVLVDKDASALPPEEQERFRRFLPMCSDLPIAKGTSCTVQEEEMLFVNTEKYGWMPELLVRYRPELLQSVADWKEPETP